TRQRPPRSERRGVVGDGSDAQGHGGHPTGCGTLVQDAASRSGSLAGCYGCSMNARVLAAFLVPAIVVPLVAYAVIDHGRSAAADRVSYTEVQGLFASAGCTGCHPSVNSALNLQQGASYGA